MVDLDGLDIASCLACDGGGLRHHAFAILHGYAHFEQLFRTRNPGCGKRPAGIRRCGQKRDHGFAIPRLEGMCEPAYDLANLVEPAPERFGVVEGDAAPELRRSCSDASGIFETACRQPKQCLLIVGMTARKLHERGSDDMRHVAHDRNRFVVLLP